MAPACHASPISRVCPAGTDTLTCMLTMWHLAEPDHWREAQRTGTYERSTRGATLADVGFVHCSYPDRLPAVVEAVYHDVSGDYLVLEIDRHHLERANITVVDEPGSDEPGAALFPHVYGPIPVAAVRRVLPARVERGRLRVQEEPVPSPE